MSLGLSNNPKTIRVYSLMFIVDIEEKKKNINNKKIKKELLLRQLSLLNFKNKR